MSHKEQDHKKNFQAIIYQKSLVSIFFKKTDEFGFKKEPDNHKSLRAGNQICLKSP